MKIVICVECKTILTTQEINKYGDKCEKHAKEHAESFPERVKKLGELIKNNGKIELEKKG